MANLKLAFKSVPARQRILDSWPRALDDSEAHRDWGWRARYDLEAMSDDLIAAIHALDGTTPPTAKKAPKTPPSKPNAVAKR